ncbi:amidohydrolase [Caballeronia arvi]|uniref:Amidohydrolase n=1 Tax=Caballeronia arvi TaxID=1777135 RepID=A0A158KS54_9BURK|nr:M20 aminoacylase family protein [Caballeronia arvi]SAL83563.1 amidohydrolase [Caballeronia arvi]
MTDVLPRILDTNAEFVSIRRRIHAHPELSLEEHDTSDLVAERLHNWGYEVYRGLAKTGVVGTLKVGDGTGRLGLRADMDALPISETTGLPYASQNSEVMHACGHDGHTAILLCAARYLSETRHFSGTLNVIFQPAEERYCGAKIMVNEGLFEKFPCDMVFALHNRPGEPMGKFGFLAGSFMASSDTVYITIQGKGGHGATPHLASDPVIAAAHIVIALQTIVSRNTDPLDTAVISIGEISGGTVSNVIPESVRLTLSVRALRPEIQRFLHDRIVAVVEAQAATLGCKATVDYQWGCPAVVNDVAATEFARQVALDWVGCDGLIPDMRPTAGAEDFSFMLQAVPSCYFIVGNGTSGGHADRRSRRVEDVDASSSTRAQQAISDQYGAGPAPPVRPRTSRRSAGIRR